MNAFWDAIFAGFFVALGLIMAIGAQNAFILKQGLRKEYVLPLVFTCAFSDALLIASGVAGFGIIVETVPWLIDFMRYGGAAFVGYYGLRSFMAAAKGGGNLDPSSGVTKSLKSAVLTCLALTWLNPHVYLDTVVLIGSISTQYANDKIAFAAGAITASFAFFFTLGYGARLLRPLFARPVTWRVLDVLIGIIMWKIAFSLLFE